MAEALQLAYSALRQAVELERKRQDEDVDPDTWAAEIHELRTMMSAAGLMMRSIGLSRFTSRVDWAPKVHRPSSRTSSRASSSCWPKPISRLHITTSSRRPTT
ncbi:MULTISPECIES: hypothetical protein [Kribbella]|uniref:hypothetical protein n=1 Tax=Kribbella TaxID=182639 RepID=UPI00104DF966|nr:MULTISPECIES: hypothetical protein [Kribbella]